MRKLTLKSYQRRSLGRHGAASVWGGFSLPAISKLSMSESDAVDGSSTGTCVPWMWALLRLPRFRGVSHADDNDNRFRHRQVGFPELTWRPGDCSPAIEASLCPGVLPEAVAMSGRYLSLWLAHLKRIDQWTCASSENIRVGGLLLMLMSSSNGRRPPILARTCPCKA